MEKQATKAQTTEDLEEEINALHEAIYIRGEYDLEFFSKMFFSHYCRYPFNPFHYDTFEYYSKDRMGARRSDGAPRGYAKSTIKTLIKPIHDICYGKEKYLLFISATKPQALQKLKDIRRELLTNDLLLDVYGVRFPNRKPGSENFEVFTDDGGVLLQAIGAGTEIRGARYGEHRPTKIILDDVEDSEEVDNEELREKTANWFFEVITQLGSNDTNIEVVGTILHRKSLLMRLKQNPAYTSKIYKAVISWAENQDLWKKWEAIYLNLDNDNREVEADQFYQEHEEEMLKGTKVLWPEKEPYLYLMKEMASIGRRAFMKEKQNAPMASGEALFDNLWWYYEDIRDGVEGITIERTGRFIPYSDLEAYGALDPATGESKAKVKKNRKLDFSCLCGGYQDLKGRLFVHRDWTKRAKPSKYIEQIFEMQELMGFNKFGIEENLYRGLLTENIRREKRRLEAERRKAKMKNWGIKVPFYEIENREKKEKRIYTLEPKVSNGWILFNRTLSMDFMDMIENFPHAEHDDAPDALEMLWGMVTNKYEARPINLSIQEKR